MYQGLPIDEWPEFKVLWDENQANIHWYGGSGTKDNLQQRHPNGLKIADVNLVELDLVTSRMCQQRPSEFWQIGSSVSKVKIIQRWIEGMLITPSLIYPHENGEQIAIDGNHRLAVARAKGEETVSVLFDTNYEVVLSQLITLRNIRGPQ